MDLGRDDLPIQNGHVYAARCRLWGHSDFSMVIARATKRGRDVSRRTEVIRGKGVINGGSAFLGVVKYEFWTLLMTTVL
jgi:hypothetical protein